MEAMTYDQRLDHLLSTAVRTFAEKGFFATTMRDLSRETGMSLAGMYYYVTGKEQLLALIQERTLSDVLEGAETAVQSASDPIERVKRLIHHHVTFFAGHMDEMKVLSHEAESLSDKRQATIDRLKRRYVELMVQTLEAVDPGASSAVPARVAAYALFGMMNWIYTWYDVQGSISPDELARHFTEIYLQGIARSAPSVTG
jgi:AcrR family transcriptional regulator